MNKLSLMDEIFEIKLKIIRDGKSPKKMSSGAVGYDIFARLDNHRILKPGERAAIPAGFAIELPENFEAQIRPRSGLAINHGITMLNSPGTIDSDYRGEVKVIIINLGQKPVTIRNGDRIAQMIVTRTTNTKIRIVENLFDTRRGKDGFGSTGYK